YRYRCLGAARAKAARLGWKGAFYAWESAATGDEVAPSHGANASGEEVEILSGCEAAHISADVARAVWRYWRATEDDAFLIAAGAEIIMETARFWASRAVLEPDGWRHIRDVEGPDEYHPHVDDNAFTNGMARWNLARALEVAELFGRRWPEHWAALSGRIALNDEELADWQGVADSLATGLDPDSGLYEQFSGYFQLETIDLGPYAGRETPMDVILGPERTRRSQVIKQADVVQLLADLPEHFDRARALANFRFYSDRCAHGSSLSHVTHALAAAQLGESEVAMGHFRQAVAIDLGEDARRSQGGLHMAALGGLWQTAVLGFGGLSAVNDELTFEPRLPRDWTSLSFPIMWRGRQLGINITHDSFTASLLAGRALRIKLHGATLDLEGGREARVDLAAGATRS
ncbi:MAG: glycosyl hydrolase family 65 protein, partial [Caulobacteraceae bacterium]